jgi:hypothetical protein
MYYLNGVNIMEAFIPSNSSLRFSCVLYYTAAMYAHGTDYSFKVITFEPEHIKVVWYLVGGGRVSDASLSF